MYVYEEIEFINSRGVSVLFDGNPYGLVSIEGLGDVESEAQSQKAPYIDGVDYIESVFEPRYLPTEILIRGKDYSEVASLRRDLSSILNPKLGLGELHYRSPGGREYIIPAVGESVPVYPDLEARGELWQRGLVTFMAPNPYWRSPNETAKPLVAYVGNFKLPMTFPFMLGTSGSKTTLYNDGDVPAPVRIEMHGPTTNPQIFNRTTGEYIRINRTIAQGEVMHINTESGRQRITVTDEEGKETSAFGYLDHNSDLFYLELGENIIEHVADAGNRHAEVIVRWDSMFVGV